MADLRPTDDNQLRHEKGEDRDAFLRVAHARWKASHDAEAGLRKRMLDDKKFYAGEHWDEGEAEERKALKLPALTIDRLGAPKRQITNALAQGRPSIQVNPVEDSDVEKAQALQGVIRNIERASQADVVYATAADDAVIMGRGFWRVSPEYCDETNVDPNDPASLFRQDLKLKRIRNAFSVYPDPACQELDYRDANYYLITDDIPLWRYPLEYPDSELAASLNDFQGVGDPVKDWVTNRTVRVAEYYYVESTTYEQWLIRVPLAPVARPDGSPDPTSPKFEDRIIPGGTELAEGIQKLATRTLTRRQVKWALINAIEVLDGNKAKTAGRDMPGRWIPIVPMLGEEIDIEGKVDLRGMVRTAKDPSRVFDYGASMVVEQLQTATRAPWIVAEGQVDEHPEWKDANRKRYPYLEYKPTSHNGQLVGPPIRNSVAPDLSASIGVVQLADDHIKGSTGFFDPSLGKAGGDESGKAILARQRQGELGSSHFAVGQIRAIRFTGELLVDLIPAYYDAPRVERILGPDNVEETVMLHAGQPPAATPEALEILRKRKGYLGIYDVSTGRYDITCSVAPSTETQRQENVETMLAGIQADPSLLYVIGDILYESMDTPVAKKLAARIKKVLRPEVREQEEGGEPDVAAVMQQLQASQQELQQMAQAFQQAQEMLRTDAQKLAAQSQQKQIEAESRVAIERMQIESAERIAALHAQTELAKVQAQLVADERMAKLEALIAEMSAERQFRRGLAEQGIKTANAIVVEGERANREDHREGVRHLRGREDEDAARAHADEREDIRFEREREQGQNGDGAQA